MKVVLLARVSTNQQDYDRQIVELTQHCEQMGWEICNVFTNKISGAKKNEDRQELMEMFAYIEKHQIDKVCVLEISRLGRNTLEALKVIEQLNEKGICLYIKNYNIETIVDGKINPVASLICTILLEIGSMERLAIKERMSSGRTQYIERCRRDGIKMGRPATYRKSDEKMKEQYTEEIKLLRKGISLKNIYRITGTSTNTLLKLKRLI
jgi:DNA invertase Pin-like site-specific DNA recombinase